MPVAQKTANRAIGAIPVQVVINLNLVVIDFSLKNILLKIPKILVNAKLTALACDC